MTEPAELTDEETSELAEALRNLVQQLEAALEEARAGAKPVKLDQQSVGRVSRIDAIQQQQMAAAGKRSMDLRLRQARSALRAVDEDEYGFCRRCEEPIGYRRLAARPETPFCLACQSGRERT
ncbi:MAG: TraR/DksA C4-type zinc finger protein [Myxococcota bacterium]